MQGPRLIADEMLGKLARELRALGYDCAYEQGRDDEHYLARAHTEDRRLLTRDRRLAERAGDQAVLVRSLDPADQVEEVLDACALRPREPDFLTRCLVCNEALVEAGADAETPDDVDDTDPRRCPSCQRTYWSGSHVRDMRGRLARHWRRG